MSYSDNSFNPSWNSALEGIPEEYHEKLTNSFREWDTNVNNRFSKIHGEYSDFKQFRDAGYNSEQIDFALGVARAIQERPDEIFNALGEYHGYFESDEDEDDDYSQEDENDRYVIDDPRLDNLEEGYNLLAEAWLRDKKAQQEAYADAALDTELDAMYEKYGEFDEAYVLTQIAYRGLETEEAVQDYFDHVDKVLSSRNRPKAPKVFGSGGGIPQQGKVNLSDAKSRKEYGAAILQNFFGNR